VVGESPRGLVLAFTANAQVEVIGTRRFRLSTRGRRLEEKGSHGWKILRDTTISNPHMSILQVGELLMGCIVW
jgi:hypothetical protein